MHLCLEGSGVSQRCMREEVRRSAGNQVATGKKNFAAIAPLEAWQDAHTQSAVLQTCTPSSGLLSDTACVSGFRCCNLACATELSRADLLVALTDSPHGTLYHLNQEPPASRTAAKLHPGRNSRGGVLWARFIVYDSHVSRMRK